MKVIEKEVILSVISIPVRHINDCTHSLDPLEIRFEQIISLINCNFLTASFEFLRDHISCYKKPFQLSKINKPTEITLQIRFILGKKPYNV